MDSSPLSLATQRLEIRLPTPDYAPRVVDFYARNAEHLGPWEPIRGPEFLTESWWERQLDANIQEFQAERGARFMLLEKGDPEGKIIGVVSLSNVVRGAFQAANLGYSIDNEFQGRGYMREALEEVLRWAFDDLGLHRVMANYRPENERSGRLLSRLGFEREGYARDYLHIAGRWCDHILTARVRPR